MSNFKPGTPVRTVNPLIFNNETKGSGVEGLIVRWDDGSSQIAYYEVLFPSEGVVKTLVFPGEIEVDIEKLPLGKVDVAARDVKLGDIILDPEGVAFVVDVMSQSTGWDKSPAVVTDEATFGGFLRDRVAEKRASITVEDINTYSVVALRRPEV